MKVDPESLDPRGSPAASGRQAAGISHEADRETGKHSLSDEDFRFFAQYIGKKAGIYLSDAKRDLVYGRLLRRLRSLGMNRFSDYREHLINGDGTEVEHFVNALTTNLTNFFREVHHFEMLEQEILPRYIRGNTQKRLRIWSSGCSTGEEPYSIAMTVLENMPPGWDIRILATDLDTNAVATAKQGVYPLSRLKDTDPARVKKWVLRGRGENEGQAKMHPDLQRIITFKPLNLIEPWPMKGLFDIVFCRNVIIYFTKETQKALFARMAQQMQPSGYLFIGHSESLFKVSDQFRLIGTTAYQKIE